jgi:hypothetical protein
MCISQIMTKLSILPDYLIALKTKSSPQTKKFQILFSSCAELRQQRRPSFFGAENQFRCLSLSAETQNSLLKMAKS